MTVSKRATVIASEEVFCRQLRDLRGLASALKPQGMTPLQICEAIIEDRLLHKQTREFFSGLDCEDRHFWISSLYALLMPKARRRRLSAYFTPPYLAQYAIDLVVDAGIRPGKDSILDPASGGAAFLVPLADRIAADGRESGLDAVSILSKIETTLGGIEIDCGLTGLSHALLANILRRELSSSGKTLGLNIEQTDALKLGSLEKQYDAVIGNPPYGRVYRPSSRMQREFAPVITDSYVNLYALFIAQALRWVRPGGVVCLIVPISFIGGPHFGALRYHILESARVISVDLIDKRNDVFLDVLYDICVLMLEKKSGKSTNVWARSSLLFMGKPARPLGYLDIPSFQSDRVWAIPDGVEDDCLFGDGLETLEDYGYTTKAGYFVWNREQHRYRTGKKPRAGEVPLFWAHNVKANEKCEPRDDKSRSQQIGFVKIDPANRAVISTDALILQRTTNRRQKRRLIAAVIRQTSLLGKRGFVSENHTILIIPNPDKDQAIPLGLMCRLLNTAAVDARFRRISGTVSVSTRVLRTLPLPKASEVRSAFSEGKDDERSAELAYARSISQNGKPKRHNLKSLKGSRE